MFCEIFPRLNQHSVVLTANQRLSLRFCQSYDQWQAEKGHIAWPSIKVMPFTAWLIHLWQQFGAFEAVVLNHWQELTLWQQVISQHAVNHNDCSPSLAKTAQQAWHMLLTWEVPLSRLTTDQHEATLAFCQWLATFRQLCQQQGWISPSLLPQQLKNRLHKSSQLPQQIYLLGFDELPPAHASLLKTLQAQCTITYLQPPAVQAKVQRTTLPSPTDEIQAMAEWAHAKARQDPDSRIGCVVPNLSTLRADVERIFNQIFTLNPATQDRHSKPLSFNLSAGKPLSQYLIIQTALHILSLDRDRLTIEQLAFLFSNPYLVQHPSDASFAAQVDLALRKTHQREFHAETVLEYMRREINNYPQSTWLKRWLRWVRMPQTTARVQTPPQWIQTFTDLLQAFAWPGQRDMHSEEYQLIERWKKLLLEFAQLGLITPDCQCAKAIQQIQHMAQSTIFQPEGSEGAVQVLGTLEAGGYEFDNLWVMGLTDESWPPAANPNPFIPPAMQRYYQLPHADAERELVYTERTMQRLLQSAPDIIFSHAQFDGDKLLQASALIKRYPLIDNHELVDLALPALIQTALNTSLEKWQDHQAPPLSKHERISAGSNILTLQSSCPFRAFAEIRCKAKAMPSTYFGLSPSQRGNLVHKALENIWHQLGDWSRLQQCTSHELLKLVQGILESIIEEQHDPTATALTQQWLSLEKERLLPLLLEWLNCERQRPPFKVVAIEQEFHLQVGPITLRCRLDRIDELSDGARVIIDYKTNSNKIQDWLTDRPKQPQLIIYCCFQDQQHYAGVTFAQLIAGKPTWIGLWQQQQADMMQDFPRIQASEDWLEQCEHWQKTITQLAEEFYQGVADVSPAHEDSCRYCHLTSFCRIQQPKLAEDDA